MVLELHCSLEVKGSWKVQREAAGASNVFLVSAGLGGTHCPGWTALVRLVPEPGCSWFLPLPLSRSQRTVL